MASFMGIPLSCLVLCGVPTLPNTPTYTVTP